jgi:hypothetical protein
MYVVKTWIIISNIVHRFFSSEEEHKSNHWQSAAVYIFDLADHR